MLPTLNGGFRFALVFPFENFKFCDKDGKVEASVSCGNISSF